MSGCDPNKSYDQFRRPKCAADVNQNPIVSGLQYSLKWEEKGVRYSVYGKAETEWRVVFQLQGPSNTIKNAVFQRIEAEKAPTMEGEIIDNWPVWRLTHVNGNKIKVNEDGDLPDETPLGVLGALFWSSFIAAESTHAKFKKIKSKKNSNPLFDYPNDLSKFQPRLNNSNFLDFVKNVGIGGIGNGLDRTKEKLFPGSTLQQAFDGVPRPKQQTATANRCSDTKKHCSCCNSCSNCCSCSSSAGRQGSKSNRAAAQYAKERAQISDAYHHGMNPVYQVHRHFPQQQAQNNPNGHLKSAVKPPEDQRMTSAPQIVHSLDSVARVAKVRSRRTPRNTIAPGHVISDPPFPPPGGTGNNRRTPQQVSPSQGPPHHKSTECGCGCGCGCNCNCGCGCDCHHSEDSGHSCRDHTGRKNRRTPQSPVARPQRTGNKPVSPRSNFGIVNRADPEKGRRIAAPPCDVAHDMACSAFNPLGKHRLDLAFCGVFYADILDCCVQHDLNWFCGIDLSDRLALLEELPIEQIAFSIFSDVMGWVALTSARFAICILNEFISALGELSWVCQIVIDPIAVALGSVASYLIGAALAIVQVSDVVRVLSGDETLADFISLRGEHDICCVCGGTQASFCEDTDQNPELCIDECGRDRDLCDERHCSATRGVCFYKGQAIEGQHTISDSVININTPSLPVCDDCFRESALWTYTCPGRLTAGEIASFTEEGNLVDDRAINRFSIRGPLCPPCN